MNAVSGNRPPGRLPGDHQGSFLRMAVDARGTGSSMDEGRISSNPIHLRLVPEPECGLLGIPVCGSHLCPVIPDQSRHVEIQVLSSWPRPCGCHLRDATVPCSSPQKIRLRKRSRRYRREAGCQGFRHAALRHSLSHAGTFWIYSLTRWRNFSYVDGIRCSEPGFEIGAGIDIVKEDS